MLEGLGTAAWQGLAYTISWPYILYPLGGTLLVMTFSFLPGIRAVTLTALAIPLTFGWEPLPVLLLFGALIGGGTFMGSVTAILLNIPGNPPNAATLIDGHPMARQGHAKTALACAAVSSALGSTFGIAVLILLLPVMREAILLFGPPEILMLAILGFTAVTAVNRGSAIKGFSVAGIGLLLSFIGRDPRTAELRYTFGSLYLWDGLNMVPLFLGLFSVAEMIDLAVSGRTSISEQREGRELSGSIVEGAQAVFRNFGLFLRCSVLGTVVGIIPGVGASVASFVAYGHAVQSAGSGGQNFGRGDIRGVLAPEAANDAKDGGSLVPTLAFGIPGNEATALLLVALSLHGLSPGKELMGQHLSMVFVLIWALFLSNWLTSILGVSTAGLLARITLIPVQRMVPVMVSLALVGAFAFRGRPADVAVTLLFGVTGYYMKKHSWPRVPMVIALVLGGLFEINLQLTVQLQKMGRIELWSRPVTVILMVVIVLVISLPALRGAKARRAEA